MLKVPDMRKIICYTLSMFIKITKAKTNQYVQLVKSYREDGRVKHKVVLNLGKLEQIENNPSFQRLAKRLAKISKLQQSADIKDCSEADIVNWGYLIYQKIWKEYGLDKLLSHLTRGRKVQFSLSDASFLMVVQHLMRPRSKLATYNHQGHFVKGPKVTLNQLYRSLDLLCEYKEQLEEALFQANRNLFNMQIDMVFYDVTTFSFESVRADSLRDFGFSKNGKFKEVQVVMGLMIDCEGRPIGYELFPGNTFDGKTLDRALAALKERFNIRRVIIVADRGINSKVNLKKIVDQGYSYIFASCLKKMSKSVQKEIFTGGYEEMEFPEGSEDRVRYKVIDYVNKVKDENGKIYKLPEYLVITYSEKRAKKDREDRSRLLEKARFLLEDKSKIKAGNKRGCKKYLKEISSGQVDWTLDEEAVLRDEKFDGYYGIQTSEKALGPLEVLLAYHTLWKIEESFRIMKSTLEVQPIFHWTETRIKGHFVACFLAFLLERTLELKLKRAGEHPWCEQIREALNSLNFSKVDIDDKTYLIKTRGTELSKKILRLLRFKPLPNVMSFDEFAKGV